MTGVKFEDFRPELATYFTALNLAWIEKYFIVEEMDKMILGDPMSHIISKGGFIYFAIADGKIAGTFALIRKPDNSFELGKMAIAEEYQGKNIGNLMLTFCISKAKALAINKIILYSNTILQPAIHLYRKYGFKEVPLNDAEYSRSNIKMELDLN